MANELSDGKIPATLARELRSNLASIGIKLTLAAEQYKQEIDPERAQVIREHVLRLKAEAKEIVDKYKWAKSLYDKDLVSEAENVKTEVALDGVLVFGDADVTGTDAIPDMPRKGDEMPSFNQAESLAAEVSPLVFEISELSLPRTGIMPPVAAPAPEPVGLVLDEVAASLDVLDAAIAAPQLHHAPTRGGLLGRALALSVDLAAHQMIPGTYVPKLSVQLACLGLVIEFGGDETAFLAAALDPAAEAENSEAAMKEIRETYGMEVAELVEWSAWLKLIDPWEHRDRAWAKTIHDGPPGSAMLGISWRIAMLQVFSRRYQSGGTGALEQAGRERERLVWSNRALAKAFRTVETAPLVDVWERVIDEFEQRR